MLKALPPNAFAGLANAKCGEIFCQSSTSFSIICTFCEMKCFNYDDFLLHFKNAHFENDLLKADELPHAITVKCVFPKSDQSDIQTGMVVELLPNDVVQGDNDANWHASNDQDGYDVDDDENGSAYDKNEEDNDLDASNPLDNDVAKIVNWQAKTAPTSTANQKLKPKQSGKLKNGIIATYGNNSEGEEKAYNDREIEDYIEEEDVNDEEYKPPASTKQKEYKCEHCNRVYLSKGAHTQHMRREHDYSEIVSCSECQLELQGPRQYDNHLVEAHGGIPCSHCEKRYRFRRELVRHEIKHTGEPSIVCDFDGCCKRFFHVRNMHSHRKVHSLEKNFICENCGYSCRNKETLRVHSRTHTGERPYACKTCNKRFPSHSRLREHEAMHSSSRPHVCTVCKATFARQKALYHHKFLHLDQKKFVCKICGNAYAQQAGLAGHMRKHKEGTI